MARQLWLLRHGEAESHGARPDPDRRLTPRGEQQARDAGAALAALDLEVDVLFASPKVRAWETAVLAAPAVGAEVVRHDPLADGFDADDALELLAGADADAGRIVVAGHNPDLSQVVHDLTGARIELKKGGVAVVRVAGGRRGELLALLRPKELTALAAALAGRPEPGA